MIKNRLAFNFEEGTIISDKYSIISNIGHGTEGEVYLVREIMTGIERAIKFFYPTSNKKNQNLLYYAKKLHRLRHCSIVTQYYSIEKVILNESTIYFLVSEYVQGQLLSDYVDSYPKKKLPYFEALHILYALVVGMEEVHLIGEYHGDLHAKNIIINRYGLNFDLKVFDMYHLDSRFTGKIKIDVHHILQLFVQLLGGKKLYRQHPQYIKNICCGLKINLINKKYKSASDLKNYLENLTWEDE